MSLRLIASIARTLAGRGFYARLNQILDGADFAGYVESLTQRFYADEVGRPGRRARHCLQTETQKARPRQFRSQPSPVLPNLGLFQVQEDVRTLSRGGQNV